MDAESAYPIASLLDALHFAADKHRHQRRKGVEALPYINHPIEVAELLARVAGVTDVVTLQAAVLHDTLEDTETTPLELEERFGREVRAVVEEVSDDRRIAKSERKRLQVQRAPHLSTAARLIRIADKISNVQAIHRIPPRDWSLERRREYLEWSARVVAGCRGCCPELERLYDQALETSRRALEREREVADA